MEPGVYCVVAPAMDLALRVERSRELEAFPEIQYGIASTFLIHGNATLTSAVLRGRFSAGLAADDDDNTLDDVTRIGAQFSLAF